MKRRALPLLVLGGALAAFAAERPAVRNPFWPIDYAGVSTPISAEVRAPAPVKPPAAEPVLSAKKAAAAEAAARAAQAAAARAAVPPPRQITREDWVKARRALKISSPVVFQAADGTRRTTVNVNGNIYGENDLMSVTTDGIRFTWRVRGLDESSESLRLVRVKARLLEENAKKGTRK